MAPYTVRDLVPSDQMRAAVQDSYGPPEVLDIREVARPIPTDHEVLIRVRAAVVTPPDGAFRKGQPLMARLFAGLLRPKSIPGSELAGEVVAIGANVSRFSVGDRVFGTAAPKSGAHAEYKCLPEDGVLAKIPIDLSYEDAVAIIDGGLTALPFLTEAASIESGHEVLVNGASGSVGAAAVQLAKHFGATVTGVCSTANVDLVGSLGADHVIDYTAVDFTTTTAKYDIIFDAIGKSSFSQCKDSLQPGGIYLTTVPSLGIMFQMLRTRLVGNKRAKIAFTGLTTTRERLTFLEERAIAGDLRPLIDRRYAFADIAEAHRYVDSERKKGSVVITL